MTVWRKTSSPPRSAASCVRHCWWPRPRAPQRCWLWPAGLSVRAGHSAAVPGRARARLLPALQDTAQLARPSATATTAAVTAAVTAAAAATLLRTAMTTAASTCVAAATATPAAPCRQTSARATTVTVERAAAVGPAAAPGARLHPLPLPNPVWVLAAQHALRSGAPLCLTLRMTQHQDPPRL